MTLWNVFQSHSPFAAKAGLVATISLASFILGCPSTGVGDRCTPEDEYRAGFAGFVPTEVDIESRSFQCQTRICLVNYYQGRTTCPGGQPAPTLCNSMQEGDGLECAAVPTANPPTESKGTCTEADVTSPVGGPCVVMVRSGSDCVASTQPTVEVDGQVVLGPDALLPRSDPNNTSYTACQDQNCPADYSCNPLNNTCVLGACFLAGSNQCTIPGTDNIPITVEVCGECAERPADDAVYCSCRCGVAEGEPEDENFNFCDCPEGYVCAELRKNLGLGDQQLTGKYCVREGTLLGDKPCTTVSGHYATHCIGSGAL